MSTEKRRHDWNNLEGEALELAIVEACGDPPDSDDWDGPDSLLTFETLTTIVWDQYLKPRGWTHYKIRGGMEECGAVAWRDDWWEWANGPTSEIALARAFGKALEAEE